MKSSHILTIAIPTYNRSAKLKRQVEILLPQLTSDVLLLILDNNSDYNIDEILSIKNIDNVAFVKNRVNIGADANIAKAFELCSTKWLWTLSDDDIVSPNAVNQVLKIINEKDNAVSICLNSSTEFETFTYADFMNKMKSWSVYSEHFWISLRIYNMYKLNPFIIECYKNISSMISPLMMLIKYLEKNDDLCVSTRTQIIDEAEKTTSWNRTDFILRSSQIYDLFCDNKLARSTLFCGVTELNLRHLCTCFYYQDITLKRGRYIFRLLNFKYGYFNCIKSFPILMIKLYAYLLFSYSFVRKLAYLNKLLRNG